MRARCNQKVPLQKYIKICATCSQAIETVRRQIQPGLVLIFGQLENKSMASQMPSRYVRRGFTPSVTRAIA